MPRPLRLLLAALICLAAAVASACGPEGPTEAGGDQIDPAALLKILPSPDQLRGDPAQTVAEDGLLTALTGSADPEMLATLRQRGMVDAAVRSWRAPDGGELVAAVSVWEAHLLATGIGGQAAELLRKEGGASWTPRGLNGSRGARIEQGRRQERRLAFAVGPNSIYVRSAGPVDEEIVVEAMNRLLRSARAASG